MFLIPAYISAMQDRALRGHAREVYLWCYENLDVLEFRVVKHAVIERAMDIDETAVARSIALLVGRGYLDRGARDGRVWTYRLFYSRDDGMLTAIRRPSA